jgi:hypothetical protein
MEGVLAKNRGDVGAVNDRRTFTRTKDRPAAGRQLSQSIRVPASEGRDPHHFHGVPPRATREGP